MEIDRGNHAQFGWYGEQKDDIAATISLQEQQDRVIEATTKLLATID